MKIAIYSRLVKLADIAFLRRLFKVLAEQKIEVWIYEPYYQQLYSHVNFIIPPQVFNDGDDLSQRVQYLWSIGGDGTLLNTITLVKNTGVPVLGINIGRLGLLADVNPTDIKAALHTLKNKEYSIDKRTLLSLHSNLPLFNGVNYALNEFTIHKRDSSSMITIHTYVNGIFLNSYWADGIIVATPTGSTAYSLSCGGPIMYPSSQTFIVTPVAPHNLNVRPVVIPDTTTLSFEIEGRGDNFLCTLDSRYETIDKSYSLSVKKANFTLNLVRMRGINFFSTIRSKLMWGQDSRGYNR